MCERIDRHKARWIQIANFAVDMHDAAVIVLFCARVTECFSNPVDRRKALVIIRKHRIVCNASVTTLEERVIHTIKALERSQKVKVAFG